MPKLFVSAFGFSVLFPKLKGVLADFFFRYFGRHHRRSGSCHRVRTKPFEIGEETFGQ
jgi:hypothetical protein